ncbi:beta-ketoacyl synthase N-terminal-like domain-containing protein [Dapis sp. BLCC M229]|uniref:beta-ketoacyl synthase N-terminal-like domain-containing protein n=1 Tax=Dapis sp. BLCC M229 TaxID=3400188 RepID=UPI003CE6910C
MDNQEELRYIKLIEKASKKLAKLESELDALKRQNRDEPIAIIGMGCRFPENANNPEAFWNLLHQGVDGITEVPSERWNIDEYYTSESGVPGTVYTRGGGFLNDIDLFDPKFFGISPREALSIDPQHRLLLEVSWEALEHGGQSPEDLENSRTGIFVGITQTEYGRLQISDPKANELSIYDATGSGLCFGSGRLSFLLGFQGPNIAIDTGCSSSLVAIHLACQSLRFNECNLAVAGGVNLNLFPETTMMFCSGNVLSPDSRCKSFDSSANGMSRSEGCGMIALKKLSDAIAHRDRIWAVIKGSAINHNGISNGLTVPNQMAQEEVIRQAIKNAEIEPTQVNYVEAHGTGTSLGDPIEVGALTSVLCPNRSQSNPLVIGSVKSNFGHSESAAGIMGLMKVVLSLDNEEIPPHLHFSKPSPYIAWDENPLLVPTSLMAWPRSEKPRIAGVSSFGMSGTNSHIILEEPPIQVRASNSKLQSNDLQDRSHQLLTLSAKTETALKELVTHYQKHLQTHPELELADVCYTANTGRSHFQHRLAILAENTPQLTEKLLQLQQPQPNTTTGVFSGKLPNHNTPPKIAFLFTGQGSQYINMGLQLYETQSVFRQTIDECNSILGEELEYPLREIIYPQTDDLDSGIINQTNYTQPALFAIEYALYKLWESWGIKPDVVMGHSIGEYVAATVAGIFSLKDGLKLIAKRGKLMQELPSGGQMVSVMANESKVKELIGPYVEKVAIAAINGPESVVISGGGEAIEAIVSQLELEGIKSKRLEVSHGFHSPLMEPMLGEFEKVANRVRYNQPQVKLISNVTGKQADERIRTAKYWVDHVREAVQFAHSMETLDELGYEVFLEIGPKPVLIGMGRECLVGKKKKWLGSLRAGKKDRLQMLESVGKFYVEGVKIDWLELDEDNVGQKVVLPTYPFQRKRYWITDIQNRKKKISQGEEQQVKTPVVAAQIEKPPSNLSIQKIKLSNPGSFSIPEVSLLKSTPKIKLAKLTVKSIEAESLKLTQEIIEPQKTVSIVENSPTQTPTKSNLGRVDMSEIKQTLKQKLADVLYVDISEIEEDKKFIDLGLDSIVGVEWITTINNLYGLRIKATKIYNYPTLLELSEYVAQELLTIGNDERLYNQKDSQIYTYNNINNQTSQLETSKLTNSFSAKVNFSELKQVLKQKLADVLYVDISEIEEDQKFIDLGLDSIVGVEWITTINNLYGLEIKATKIYDYPTLINLTEYVAQEISQTSRQLLPQLHDSSIKKSREIPQLKVIPEENFRKQLRSILNQLANHNLTRKEANKMIKKLKQNAKF